MNQTFEEIIGYFNVGFPLIVSRVIGYNQEKGTIFGLIRFYSENKLLFEMDVVDAIIFADIMKRKAQELYDDMMENVIGLASTKDIVEDEVHERDVI